MTAVLTPAALARPVPLPWGGQLPLGEFLERYPVEILVHTWDLAAGHRAGCRAGSGPVNDALELARQFTPVARAAGLVGPECAVAEDADDLTRLLAIFRPQRQLAGWTPPRAGRLGGRIEGRVPG